MKVFIIYGFWKYENDTVILKVFDTLDKAKEYMNKFDCKSEDYQKFDYLGLVEKEVE